MKNKEAKHREFLELWYSTPIGDAEKIRQHIICQCFISKNIFYDWLSGRTEIPELSLQMIKNIYHELQN